MQRRCAGRRCGTSSACGASGELASSTDPVAAWNAADLDTKRAILREVLTVTLHPVGGGNRPFNPDSVVIEPRKRP